MPSSDSVISIEGRRRDRSFPLTPASLLFLGGALVVVQPVAAVIASSRYPAPVRIEALFVLVAAIANPAAALLIVAAIAPLGDVIYPLLGVHPPHHAETIVLAFLAGWLAARAFSSGRAASTTPAVQSAAWLFAVIVVASIATTCLQLYRVDAHRLHDAVGALRRDYLWIGSDMIGVHAATNLLEGLGIMIASAWAARRRPGFAVWIALVLVAGASIAAVASTLLAYGVAPAASLLRQAAFGPGRYSAAVSDLNAAASWYLLVFCVAIGLAAAVRDSRIPLLVAAALIANGLRLTGSRAALMSAALMVCVAIGAMVLRRVRLLRPSALAIVTATSAIALAFFIVRSPEVAPSLEMRTGFARASAKIIAARPLFGVGEGRYYDISALVLPPSLGWAYGRENAHNYFLQVTAELGVVGIAAFAWLLAEIVSRRATTSAVRPFDVGLRVGVVGFLMTCVTGHPFLVPETAIPFWIVSGLVVSASVPHGDGRFSRAFAVIAAIVMIASVPLRPDPPRLGLSEREDGLGVWRTDGTDGDYRGMKTFASVFVEGPIEAVELPLRIDPGQHITAIPAQVVAVGGQRIDTAVGSGWSTVHIRRPYVDPLFPRWRINIAVVDTSGRIDGGRDAVDVGRLRIVSAQRPR